MADDPSAGASNDTDAGYSRLPAVWLVVAHVVLAIILEQRKHVCQAVLSTSARKCQGLPFAGALDTQHLSVPVSLTYEQQRFKRDSRNRG